MTSFNIVGGIIAFIEPLIDGIKQNIFTTFSGLLSPITNEIKQLVSDILGSAGVTKGIANFVSSLSELIFNLKKIGALDVIIKKFQELVYALELFMDVVNWVIDILGRIRTFIGKIEERAKKKPIWFWTWKDVFTSWW